MHARHFAVLFALMLSVGFFSSAGADGRSAEDILNDLDAIKSPAFDPAKRDDQDYIAQFRAQRVEADQKRAAIILELYKAHPDHERAIKLMPQRWQILMHTDDTSATVDAEMDAVIAADPTSKLAGEARYIRAQNKVVQSLYTDEPKIAAAEEVIGAFIKDSPEDARAAQLLGMLADAHKAGSPEQIAVYERIQKNYPKSSSAKYAAGKIRQATSVGKPFELTFTDAITERTVDMKELRGQVVVIDFWATWCGPCVAEMPHMKELYEQYHGKGVEFIGVSLDNPEDQGGLEKLRTFVKEKELEWPQYYQGKGWESEFSTNWGINGIPSLFIVDKKGNLHSTEARGKLDELIPKLLAE